MLDAQVYRLSHWKAADDEINYRRFFDINELAAVCMEEPAVFAESHRLVFDLLVRGDVDGLRIDHIDGLYDPVEYLRRLQAGYLLAWAAGIGPEAAAKARPPVTTARGAVAPAGGEPAALDRPRTGISAEGDGNTCTDRTGCRSTWSSRRSSRFEESLPAMWLLAGTTGYDFLHSVGGLFVDPAGLAELQDLCPVHRRAARLPRGGAAVETVILHTAMASDLQLLAHQLEPHFRAASPLPGFYPECAADRAAGHSGLLSRLSDVHPRRLRPGSRPAGGCRAAAQAKRRNPVVNAAVFDFIRDVLLLQLPPNLDDAGRRERELFVGRWQQVTSPVMAKAIEDTAFYRYFPLASLNEVGGDPVHVAASTEEFHRHNLARQTDWPRSLTATTSHDTKRSQDTRAASTSFQKFRTCGARR